MTSTTDQTIAAAIVAYLRDRLSARAANRAFFRISSFDEPTYAALLDSFAAEDWQLDQLTLEVRSIDPVAGHGERVMDAERSATWYRNHLPANQALVLIQNRRSTDAQSLQDLYPVTELSLTRDADGLAALFAATFRTHQLHPNTHAQLYDFVRRFARVLYEPQLRDLTEFLSQLDALLDQQPGLPLGHAIAEKLPYLGLFRCLEFAELLNTVRGDKLLRQLRAAARIGGEVLDERARQEYLARLAKAQFNDDSALDGPSVSDKRELLGRFIEGELRADREALRAALTIEWREVQLVISAKSRATTQQKLNDAAEQLRSLLPPEEQRSDDAVDLLNDLEAGRAPDGDALDQVLNDVGDGLPPAVRSALRRMVKTRTRRHGDFLAGLTALAVELLNSRQAELAAGTRLRVVTNLPTRHDAAHMAEAVATFLTLFGGMQTLFPAIDWQLEPLTELLAEPEPADTDDEAERERVVRLELPFRVTLHDPAGTEIDRANLIWQYRSDSPAAATAQTLNAERAARAQIADGDPLRVPVYNSCPPTEAVGDLDIRRPIESLGVWYERPSDLRTLLGNALTRLRPSAAAALTADLDRLERAWAEFVGGSTAGILAADSATLLAAYEALLATAAQQLQTSQDASSIYRVLVLAWIVGSGPSERWAVVPLLHPLKLLWWRERARHFGALVTRLLDPADPVRIVDEVRFRRELPASYGSSNFPPILALSAGEGQPAQRFVPVDEADGYELFVRDTGQSEPFGLDAATLADDEADLAAQRAVDGIAAVIQDYIETYPFVRDGLEIVLFECRNGALPGLLAKRLTAAATRRSWPLRLTVIVHTSDRGAPLFGRVNQWVAEQQALAAYQHSDYVPPVSMKVVQASAEELLRSRDDRDIVILADVLGERGQEIVVEVEAAPPDLPLTGFLPGYQAQQEPFQHGDRFRRLALTEPEQPALVRLFLLMQHVAQRGRAAKPTDSAQFYRELSLDAWSRELNQLHDHFNWVVCYDRTIDRFLLQAAFPDKVQVIRYSLGLGAKRQHNLTVSSSHRAQEIVERRLAGRLASMLPNAAPGLLQRIAAQLVTQAKEVSGDIVLRAAGPGAFLNELIGLVIAKFETERRYHAHQPGALTTWILLDDFEHWFGGGKFPDLLFVAIAPEADGTVRLDLEIIEAKCVGQLSFAAEATDAEEQVRRGVNRLAAAFAPGTSYLDAPYWYDQFYRAVVGNLTFEREQESLWEQFRSQFGRGAFRRNVAGHVWAFCYNGPVLEAGERAERGARATADDPEIPITAHHIGRNALCQSLRHLIEAGGTRAPDSQWEPARELPVIHPPQPAEPEATPEPHEATVASPASLPQASAQTAAPAQTEVPPPVARTDDQWLLATARELNRALRLRDIQVEPIDPAQADVGPSIVRFKLRLRPKETLRKVQSVAADLARDLALASTPIIQNVARSNFVGIDIPREQPQTIALEPLLRNLGTPGPAELPVILGIAPDGALIVEDLAAFPHLLVAGSTGSGKSVFLRSLLLSLMTQYQPGKLELLIVDPKQTDFSFFDQVPHLRGGAVFTQSEAARDALLELVRSEMPRRQQLMRGRSMRIIEFNQRYPAEALPPIVAMIDEYAQLLSIMSKRDGESFERDLMSLAAVGRSVGIHLVLATQRPSADVVTSTLKANLPARIAFRVASGINSGVVLDTTGAENLLGRGDMLYRRQTDEIVRLQAPFMDEEQMQTYIDRLAAP